MKYRMFLFTVLAITAIKIEYIQTLQIYTMDTFRSEINLENPGWGLFSSGILKSHAGSGYSTGKNKTLTLSAPIGCSILAAVRLLDLRPNNQDNLTLFDAFDKTVKPYAYSNPFNSHWKTYDPREDKIIFFAPSGQLSVRFSTGPAYSTWGYDGFELTFTVQATQCRSEYFYCLNRRCISRMLRCDGHNHCGDRSDQKNCFQPTPSEDGRTAGIVCGVVFLLTAVACGIFIVIRKALRPKSETEIIIRQPPPTNLPGYPPSNPEPGIYYPPPPPPYTQGVVNPGYY